MGRYIVLRTLLSSLVLTNVEMKLEYIVKVESISNIHTKVRRPQSLSEL